MRRSSTLSSAHTSRPGSIAKRQHVTIHGRGDALECGFRRRIKDTTHERDGLSQPQKMAAARFTLQPLLSAGVFQSGPGRLSCSVGGVEYFAGAAMQRGILLSAAVSMASLLLAREG